jgi:lysozyme family protein
VSFPLTVAFTARWEGGKCDVPGDPGGRTGVCGITQSSFAAWLRVPLENSQDVWTATADQVLSFLRSYWTRIGGAGFDGIDERLGVLMFDAAYNHGQPMAIQFLQRALGGLDDDGKFGSQTFNRLHDVYGQTGNQALLDDLVNERKAHYIARALQPRLTQFLKGWCRRTDDCQRVADCAVGDLPSVVITANGGASLPMVLPGIP